MNLCPWYISTLDQFRSHTHLDCFSNIAQKWRLPYARLHWVCLYSDIHTSSTGQAQENLRESICVAPVHKHKYKRKEMEMLLFLCRRSRLRLRYGSLQVCLLVPGRALVFVSFVYRPQRYRRSRRSLCSFLDPNRPTNAKLSISR